MAEPSGTFVFKITAQGEQFRAEFDRSTRAAQASARQIESSFSSATRDVVRLGRNIAGALGLTIGVAGIVSGIRAVTREAIEGERAVNQLNATLKATGGASGITNTRLSQLAEEIKRSTVFDDDAIRQAEVALLRFRTVQGAVFEETLRLVPDVATALGTDLPAAAVALARAISDPESGMRALRAAGINLSESQKDLAARFVESGNRAGAARIVLEEVRRAVGGASEADTTGLYGATRRMSNAWDELLKSLGRSFVGESARNIANNLSAMMNSAADALSPNAPGVREVRGKIREAGEAIQTEADRAFNARIDARTDEATEQAYLAQQAALKRRADGAASYYANEVNAARDFVRQRQNVLDESYSQGELAAANYYNELRVLSERTYRDEVVTLGKQMRDIIAARDAQSTSLEERLKFEQRLRDLQNEEREAGRRFGARNVEINQAEARSVRDLSGDYDELRVKLLELRGAADEAAAARFALSSRDQRRRFESELTSTDPAARERAAEGLASLAAIGQLTEAQARYTLAVRATQSEVERLDILQRRIAIAQVSGAITELDALRQISQENRDAIPILEERARRQEDLLQTLTGADKDAALQALEELRLKIFELGSATDLVAQKFNNVFVDSFADAITAVSTGSKSLKEIIKDLERSIVQSISRIAAQNIAEALFGSGGTFGGIGSFFSSLFGGGIGSNAAGTDYWRGGATWVGERGKELVYLPRGSQVVPNHAATRGGGGVTINQTNHFSGQLDTRATSQIAAQTGWTVQRGMRRWS